MVERRGRTGRVRRAWPAAVVLVMAVTLGAACGDDGGEGAGNGDGDGGEADVETVDFEATGAFLAAASERSAAEPYRYTLTLDVDLRAMGDDRGFEAPLAEGEIDGAAFEQHVDMTEYIGGLSGAVGGGAVSGVDLTIDTVGDAETLYLRASTLGIDPGTVPAALTELGDDWGRVDLTALDASLGEIQSRAGSPTAGDPRAILEVVGEADDVEELGSSEVGGEAVDGLGATITMGDMLAGQGLDADEFAEQMSASMGAGAGLDPAAFASFMEEYMATALPVEVWVDDAGLVRRVAYTTDVGAIIEGIAPEGAGGLEAFTIGTIIDYADYGDESIDPSPPPEAEDAVDVTDAYVELLGG